MRRNSFIAGPPTTAVPPLAPVASHGNDDIANTILATGLVDLVRSSFGHRIPYSAISAMGPSELPSIVPMLYNLSEQEHWANVATVHGILGSREATRILTEFLDSDLAGSDPSAAFRAKAAALIALGYIANRFPDSDVLGFLFARTSSQPWEKAGHWAGLLDETRL
jgi:hypothetical protein